ncbi:hypothetical protein OIU91_27720 [Streptomyces sp. NBC_01456]|uniref:hypothetical protein n=1 Tax=unclassified Streptomyces TaxID=2593676 RepID=UPI002E331B46|nr:MULTISPECIES: hypothetical protein [unclassified Streptomyces]
MADQTAVVEVHVKPSPIAAWFHHLLTNPVIEVDGQEYAAKWGTTRVAVTPGIHRISVSFRYRGQKSARLAEASKEFSTAEASSVRVTASLGPRNGSRFRFEEPVAHG